MKSREKKLCCHSRAVPFEAWRRRGGGNPGLNEIYSSKGMTLIEIIIYTTLLSFLLAGFIQYSQTIQSANIQLIHEIQDQ